MSDILMTLCDTCAEKMDAHRHPENKYYLKEILGSERYMQCTRCFQEGMCRQYSMKSKAILAMERAIARQKEGKHLANRDTRAQYREPWRER